MMVEKENILKEAPAAYRAAAAQVEQTGKPVIVERQGEIAVAVLPWKTYRAFEDWYEEQERERQWREQHEAFEREIAAFERMKDELLEKYRGQYVAVYQDEVVGVSSDKLELVRQMHERFGPVTMYVHLVAEQDPVYRMPSFQVVDRLE
jgi:PHD/YefM family antitoxin component YafN of YafNO toxin-antitoxin module